MTTLIRQRQLDDIHIDTVAPGVNDDITLRYGIGSKWFDSVTQSLYICLDATDGAAVWSSVAATGGGTVSGTGTDNHIARWDGTSDIQDSAITISDVSSNTVSITAAVKMSFFTTGDDGSIGNSITFNGATTAGTVIGGQVIHQGGTATGSADAGLVKLQGGINLGTGNGGPLQLWGGPAQGATGNGAPVEVIGGSSTTSGDGGDVYLAGGLKGGGGTDGHVVIADQNTGFRAIFDVSLLASTSKTFTFPNVSGTFALTGLAGTKIYYVSDTNGGPTDRKLTFVDGILTSEV